MIAAAVAAVTLTRGPVAESVTPRTASSVASGSASINSASARTAA